MQYSYGGRWPFKFNRGAGAGLLVMRDRFDAWLVDEARRAGAEVRDGTAFDPSIEARCVIGADGVRSPVRRWLGLGELEKGAAIDAEIPASERELRRYAGRIAIDFGVESGYAWIFPKGRCLSAGILSYAPRDLRKNFEAYLEREGLSSRSKTAEWHGAEIPRGGARGPFHGERGIVVGDAAGLVDPLTGEGIHYAVWSGAIAAEVVASGAPLSNFTGRVENEIVRELAAARRMADAFYRWPRLGYAVGARSRRANAAMMDALTGRGSYTRAHRTLRTSWAGVTARVLRRIIPS